jgi:hypothetical protein
VAKVETSNQDRTIGLKDAVRSCVRKIPDTPQFTIRTRKCYKNLFVLRSSLHIINTPNFEINFFSSNVTIKGIRCKKPENLKFLSTEFQILLRQICTLLTPEPKQFFASLAAQRVASFFCSGDFIKI